ncbi:MAG: ribosome biogenesis GTPase Der [Candidatus Puniceispirillaceae bacterium]
MVSIAIVGRPNVGKSTLFNRLTGRQHAIVDNQPGVTRDRREGDATLAGMAFRLVDTAGLEQAKEGTLAARMRAQSERAIELADIILMVIDARSGLLPDDHFFARQLRRANRPVILLANKCEGKQGALGAAEAWELGLGTPVPVSAAHGEGLVDLHDAIMEAGETLGLTAALFGEDEEELQDNEDVPIQDEEDDGPEIWVEGDDEAPLSLAIIGRPNMGKSTLINTLVGEDRLLTGPEAGITRDAISLPFRYGERDFKIVDTAGIRRQARVVDAVEKLMVSDAERAIQYAQVCVLMLDGRQPPHKQDMAIARHVANEGRALVIAVNMWDAVEDKQASLEQIYDRLETSLAQLRGVPVIPISGMHGKGIDKLFKAILAIQRVWNTRISTGRLNRWLEPMLEAHPPPLVQGRRLRIRYMTQVKSRPPTFALFVSRPADLPDHYLRYLVGGLRADFGLDGIPVRMVMRKGKNPYA